MIKIRIEDLMRYVDVLEDLSKTVCSFKLAYAIAKNLKKLRGEIENVGKTVAQSPEFKEYEKKRLSLCSEHSLKDVGGNPLIVNRIFQIDPMKKNDFDIRLSELRAQYKDAIRDQDRKIEEFNRHQKDEIEIEFHRVKQEDLPREIKPSHMEVILDFLEEEDDSNRS